MLSKRTQKHCAWVIVGLGSLVIAVPHLVFPSEKYFKGLVQNAANVELQYLPAPNWSKYFTMVRIPGTDKRSLGKLSASVDLLGIWGPFTDVSGNVYRIRVTKNDGSWEDIVVLGANKIKHGNWNVAVSPDLVRVIKQVVVESGGQLPNNQVLRELLGRR